MKWKVCAGTLYKSYSLALEGRAREDGKWLVCCRSRIQNVFSTSFSFLNVADRHWLGYPDALPVLFRPKKKRNSTTSRWPVMMQAWIFKWPCALFFPLPSVENLPAVRDNQKLERQIRSQRDGRRAGWMGR